MRTVTEFNISVIVEIKMVSQNDLYINSNKNLLSFSYSEFLIGFKCFKAFEFSEPGSSYLA